MSEDPSGFLARWSRRKVDAQREESRAVPLDEAADASPIPADEPALTPEDIAALPKIEDLTPETDITVFLRKGVPDFLKNAALRRMWSLDPAIRDYVGDARDYAYDWNVVGGVPGNGPMLPTDDIAAMVRRVFGEMPAPAAEVEKPVAPAGLSPNREPGGETPEAEGDDRAAAESPAPAGTEAAEEQPVLAHQSVRLSVSDPVVDEPEPEVVRDPEPAPVRRRHGGARPV